MKKIGLDVIARLPKTKHPEEVKKEKSLVLLIISLSVQRVVESPSLRYSKVMVITWSLAAFSGLTLL